MDTFLAYVSVSMTFVPMICLLFWPASMLKDVYELFRKVVIFFAIGSSIITILYYAGLTSSIPHYELPPQTALHINRNDFYYVYFIFPELNTPGYFFQRACGMMEEPGHFSIVLGLVYLIDRYTHRKINPAIILCAVLSFSSAFFLIMLFVELWNIITHWGKVLLYVLCSVCIACFTYFILPRNMQETVQFLAYGRNLEQVTDVLSSSGSLEEALNERTNSYGVKVYENMRFEKKLFGDNWDSDIILSDYRGFIVKMGLVGFILVILISVMSLSGSSFQLKLSLILTLFLIMLHRSWFFLEPFPYFMSFIACNLYKYNNIRTNVGNMN